MERISGQGGCDCWSRVGDSTGRGQGGDVILGTNKMKSQGTEFMHEIKLNFAPCGNSILDCLSY